MAANISDFPVAIHSIDQAEAQGLDSRSYLPGFLSGKVPSFDAASSEFDLSARHLTEKGAYSFAVDSARDFGITTEQLREMFLSLSLSDREEVPLPYGVNVNTAMYKQCGAQYKGERTTFTLLASDEAVKNADLVLFDDYDHETARYPLEKQGDGDLWRVTLQDIHPGQKYRFQIQDQTFIDPFAKSLNFSKTPDRYDQYAVVVDDAYEWNDADWMQQRKSFNFKKSPVSIYECPVGLWKKQGNRPVNYRELAPLLVEHVKKYGFTHVELMSLMDHPDERSWGYQITGWFAPNHRLGSPADFKYLVNHLHENGIGVIMDFVPNHFAVDSYGLTQYQTHLRASKVPLASDLKAAINHMSGNLLFRRLDFGSVVCDYTKKDLRETLISSAHYWIKELHVDGIRVDCLEGILAATQSRLFLRDLNTTIQDECPGVMLMAEHLSSSSVTTDCTRDSGLGFDSKWNSDWNKAILRYFSKDASSRDWSYSKLKNAVLHPPQKDSVLYLSHDEFSSRHDSYFNPSLLKKWAGRLDDKSIQNDWKSLLAFQMTAPGKKLMLSGIEMGSDAFWDQLIGTDRDIASSSDKYSAFKVELRRILFELSYLYKNEDAFYDDENSELHWVNDPTSTTHAFRRVGEDKSFLIAHNFTNRDCQKLVVKCPKRFGRGPVMKPVFLSNQEHLQELEIQKISENEEETVYQLRIPKQTSVIIEE